MDAIVVDAMMMMMMRMMMTMMNTQRVIVEN